MGGLGLGPLLAGVIAEYVGAPLRTTFVVDLVLLVPACIGILLLPETVTSRAPRRRPSLAVPREVRSIFFQAALTGFAGFVVLGTFTGVSSAAVIQLLHQDNLAVVGVVVFVVFAASAAGQVALRGVPTRIALPAGAVTLTVGAVLVALALSDESLALLVVGGVVAGLGQGLGFRAGMAAVNAATPADQRAAVTSTFFVVLYVGISVPIVGIGIAAESAGLKTAGVGAAIAVAVLAAVAAASLILRPAPSD
jgi:MFS family permease